MGRRQLVRVIKQRNFLLGVIGKAQHHLTGAQIKMLHKGRECRDGRSGFALIRCLNHHDSIRIHRPEHLTQRRCLLRTGHIMARGPSIVVKELIFIIKKRSEPFNVVGRNPHQAALPEIVSQARLTSIIRFSASLIASSGKPRATSASGWFSRTSLRQAVRASAIEAFGAMPKTV